MGLTESKIVLERFSAACFEADCHRRDDIRDLLSDDNFLRLLNNLWKQIPRVSKKQIIKTNRRKSAKYATPPKVDNMSDDVPESLMKFIPQWKNNIQSFFTEEDALDLNLDHPVAESYRLLLQLENRGQRDTWRTRFLKVVFHRLLKRISSGQYTQSADATKATTIIRNSGIGDNSEQIGERLIAWGKTGQRLELLCKDLLDARDRCDDGRKEEEHLGFLFRLPKYVTDNYLRKLPKTGVTRNQEIRRLKDSGLRAGTQYSTLSDLAFNIFHHLWGFIERSLAQEAFIIQEGPILSHQAVSQSRSETSACRTADAGRGNTPLIPRLLSGRPSNYQAENKGVNETLCHNNTPSAAFPIFEEAGQSPARPCWDSPNTGLQSDRQNELLPSMMVDGFNPRQNIHPALLDGFAIPSAGSTTVDAFDPRQNIHPALLDGFAIPSAGSTTVDAFDPRQNIHPALLDGFAIPSAGSTTVDAFDPRQNIHPALLDGFAIPSAGSTTVDAFDPRQNIHPALLDGLRVPQDDFPVTGEITLPAPRASDQGMSNSPNCSGQDAQNRRFNAYSSDGVNCPEVSSQPHFQSLLAY